MFIGEYNHNLDDKGRMIMPMKFREGLGYTFYITKGLDGCLFVYSEEEWKKFSQDLMKTNSRDKNARKVQRYFLSSSIECNLDKQGRILISQALREHAHLGKNVVVVGVVNKLEIWSKERWEEYNNDDDDNIEDIMQDMDSLNF